MSFALNSIGDRAIFGVLGGFLDAMIFARKLFGLLIGANVIGAWAIAMPD